MPHSMRCCTSKYNSRVHYFSLEGLTMDQAHGISFADIVAAKARAGGVVHEAIVHQVVGLIATGKMHQYPISGEPFECVPGEILVQDVIFVGISLDPPVGIYSFSCLDPHVPGRAEQKIGEMNLAIAMQEPLVFPTWKEVETLIRKKFGPGVHFAGGAWGRGRPPTDKRV